MHNNANIKKEFIYYMNILLNHFSLRTNSFIAKAKLL